MHPSAMLSLKTAHQECQLGRKLAFRRLCDRTRPGQRRVDHRIASYKPPQNYSSRSARSRSPPTLSPSTLIQPTLYLAQDAAFKPSDLAWPHSRAARATPAPTVCTTATERPRGRCSVLPHTPLSITNWRRRPPAPRALQYKRAPACSDTRPVQCTPRFGARKACALSRPDHVPLGSSSCRVNDVRPPAVPCPHQSASAAPACRWSLRRLGRCLRTVERQNER